MVIAAVLAVPMVTEPAGAIVIFPGVPFSGAEVFSADEVEPETVRSSAEPAVENVAAIAPDNNTCRIFKISPSISPTWEAIVSAS
jgi:hypothetical protein